MDTQKLWTDHMVLRCLEGGAVTWYVKDVSQRCGVWGYHCVGEWEGGRGYCVCVCVCVCEFLVCREYFWMGMYMYLHAKCKSITEALYSLP